MLSVDDSELYQRIYDAFGKNNPDSIEISILIQLYSISANNQFEISNNQIAFIVDRSIREIKGLSGSEDPINYDLQIKKYLSILQSRKFISYNHETNSYKISRSVDELGGGFYRAYNGSVVVYNTNHVKEIIVQIKIKLLNWKEKLSGIIFDKYKILEEIIKDKKYISHYGSIQHDLHNLFDQIYSTLNDLNSQISFFLSKYIEITNSGDKEAFVKFHSLIDDEVHRFESILSDFSDVNSDFKSVVDENRDDIGTIFRVSSEILDFLEIEFREIENEILSELYMLVDNVRAFFRDFEQTVQSLVIDRIFVLRRLLEYLSDFVLSKPIWGELYSVWDEFINNNLDNNSDFLDNIIEKSYLLNNHLQAQEYKSESIQNIRFPLFTIDNSFEMKRQLNDLKNLVDNERSIQFHQIKKDEEKVHKLNSLLREVLTKLNKQNFPINIAKFISNNYQGSKIEEFLYLLFQSLKELENGYVFENSLIYELNPEIITLNDQKYKIYCKSIVGIDANGNKL